MGKTKKDLVLVYPTMDNMELKENVDIMLSPQFYTLKKETLRVKYAHQAKKIATSLFDGLLEEERNYQYTVFKEDEQWVFIAYDQKEIRAFLRSKGILETQVEKVYFAQEALASFTYPMALGSKETLVVLENTVVVMPLIALEGKDEPSLEFNNTFRPKGAGVSLKDESKSIIDNRESWTLTAVFALFAGMFLVEGARSVGDDAIAKEEMQSILEDYPGLESSYARKPELEKYRDLDKSERKKREAVKMFSGLIFKGVVLTSMDINEKSFSGQFKCVDENLAKKAQTLAKKKSYTAVIKGNNVLEIKGTL